MAEDTNKIEELSAKLDQLLSMHNEVSTEIDNLRVEIIRLKVAQQKAAKENQAPIPIEESPVHEEDITTESTVSDMSENVVESTEEESELLPETEQSSDYFEARDKRRLEQEEIVQPKKKFDIEKLIGENLINKIGILVLIIGVAIGAKYSIENDLISPLGRIILGYAVGTILLGLGMWLKKSYLNFSAVLVSGAMAIFYFITFFAFSFYNLIGQEVAFGLMVIFTIFTVIAALNYDKEVIALLGLVGAVSVPFLVSDNSGNILFLFSYLALINIGIAFISLRKNWKILFYSAFVLTWLIYLSWAIMGYEESEHFTLALGFLSLFFVLFYVIFIAYKFLNLKKYGLGDVIVLLLNALLFFAIGYNLLEDHKIGGEILGAFAIGNAFIHFIAATIINKRKLADRNIFYLIVGLVLVCLTLAIPIQLDGHWVTIMWSLEAVVLFLIGRSKRVPFYEYISFALMFIAALSLVQDWSFGYKSIRMIRAYNYNIADITLPTFLNTYFMTSVIACVSLGAINWIHRRSDWRLDFAINKNLMEILDYVLPIALILAIFFAFRLEIMHYFSEQYASTAIINDGSNNFLSDRIFNETIRHKVNVWLFNFTLFYLGLISIFVYKKTSSLYATWAMIIINTLAIISFLMGGLFELSEMRTDFLNEYNAEHFVLDNSFMWIRYISIALLAFLINRTFVLLNKIERNYWTRVIPETMLYLIIFWVLTSELIHWLDFTERSAVYGLALSIFWGIFSVVVIAIGIWKKKKHVRILGIVIFGITLVKLFFYDLSHLTTIAKTIVMISLGALLLLTSFLYNKYTIEDEEEV